MAPLVSVLVPTYDGERFVEAAVRSVLAQTHRELEVLVGDDGSTDGTPEILERLAAEDARVRVVRHATNLGAFENPIRLLGLARGEYVKVLLHDDLLHPEAVASLVAGLEAHPGATLAASKRGAIDPSGAALPDDPVLRAMTAQAGLVDGRAVGDQMLVKGLNAVGELSCTIFRRADVDPAALWRLDGTQLAANGDLALWLDLLRRGHLFYEPRELAWFRLHATQRSREEAICARGTRDWPLLIDWARRAGFLAEPALLRQALRTALANSSALLAAMGESPWAPVVLESVLALTARLGELEEPAPLALAAPRACPAEVAATVSALREVHASGRAARLVLAAADADVAPLAALVEAELTRSGDLDLELVVGEAADLLRPEWLAVAPAGAPWADRAPVRVLVAA